MAELVALDCEPPNPDTVKVLEDALEAARAGKISSVGVAIVYPSGATGAAWSKPASTATLIGAVAVLQSRLTKRITDQL